MILHNFIVDYREIMKEEGKEIYTEEFETSKFNIGSDGFVLNNPGCILGYVGDDSNAGGRPSNAENYERDRGLGLRNYYCDELVDAGMARQSNITLNGQANIHNQVNI